MTYSKTNIFSWDATASELSESGITMLDLEDSLGNKLEFPAMTDPLNVDMNQTEGRI